MVLRTKFESGYEVNKDLGREYHFIDRESCNEEFKKCIEVFFGGTGEPEKLIAEMYAFISYDNGKSIEALYKGHQNFILNETGGVFANLTYR